MFYYTILVHCFIHLSKVLIVVNLYCVVGVNKFFVSSFVDYNSVSVIVIRNAHNCHWIR
jgi:hypothetical protein